MLILNLTLSFNCHILKALKSFHLRSTVTTYSTKSGFLAPLIPIPVLLKCNICLQGMRACALYFTN